MFIVEIMVQKVMVIDFLWRICDGRVVGKSAIRNSHCLTLALYPKLTLCIVKVISLNIQIQGLYPLIFFWSYFNFSLFNMRPICDMFAYYL